MCHAVSCSRYKEVEYLVGEKGAGTSGKQGKEQPISGAQMQKKRRKERVHVVNFSSAVLVDRFKMPCIGTTEVCTVERFSFFSSGVVAWKILPKMLKQLVGSTLYRR